jgi:hypothetical protein
MFIERNGHAWKDKCTGIRFSPYNRAKVSALWRVKRRKKKELLGGRGKYTRFRPMTGYFSVVYGIRTARKYLYIIDMNLGLENSSLLGYYNVSTGEYQSTFRRNLIPCTESVYLLWAFDSGDESQTCLRNSVTLFSIPPEKIAIVFRLGYQRLSGKFPLSLKAPINLVMSVRLSIHISSIGEAAAGRISVKFDVGESYENL